MPVSLQRQSVRSGFRLVRHDDETIINPTLLQMLRNNYELRVPGLDAALPSDDKGVDVARVLQAFRLAVREIAGWEVLEQVHLGIFSFTKYLMWKDLQDRSAQLKENRVVRHLIEHPGQAFAKEGGEERYDRLDESHRPEDLLTPLLSDSSQLKAICAVDAGRDLVLEGLPGTGKSQTITNLIAHLLARGKTVLFVSEKMAALEVVHRRLSSIGLGPFCLELHSSKSRKSEVLLQLGKALDHGGQRGSDDWAREAERLGRAAPGIERAGRRAERRAPQRPDGLRRHRDLHPARWAGTLADVLAGRAGPRPQGTVAAARNRQAHRHALRGTGRTGRPPLGSRRHDRLEPELAGCPGWRRRRRWTRRSPDFRRGPSRRARGWACRPPA